MKKIFTIFCLFTAVMLTISCQKELPDAIKNVNVSQGGQEKNPEVKPSQELRVTEPGQFGAKGGEQTITVTATAAWTISKSEGGDWLTIKPESGNAGTSQVILTAAENTTTESRTATLTVKSGELTKSISVSQSAANLEISLDTNNLEFTSNGGIKTFKITTNTSWTVACDQTWCSVSPVSGKNESNITVTVFENTSILERSAIITVKSDVGNQTVKVNQDGAAAALTLSENSIEFTSASGSQLFNITSNTSWTVSTDQSWCTVNLTSDSGNGSVTVSVGENTSTSERSATITVTSDAGNKIVNVTQNGAEAVLTLSVNNLEFISSSGSQTFIITSNISYKVSSSQSWCTISSGPRPNHVKVSVDENTSTSERTATITVESETITRTLMVTQSGAELQDRTFTVGGVTFKMIAVEGGTFTMGATSEQGDDVYDSEKPVHTVTLSSYSIGETEVTQALWRAVMGSNPSYFSGSNKPVEQVSWDDCQNFIKKLNATTGENFRLPTEAEWEFAARGGNKTRDYKYAGSNTLGGVAWYWENIPSQSSGNAGYGTQNVATKQANELGLYDMSGNVWEWCSDWYGNYSLSAQTNPIGLSSGFNRVYRGGAWRSSAGGCRVSYRNGSSPTYRGSNLGLRLAL